MSKDHVAIWVALCLAIGAAWVVLLRDDGGAGVGTKPPHLLPRAGSSASKVRESESEDGSSEEQRVQVLGRIVLADGTPCPDARVRLQRTDGSDLVEITTSKDGTYRAQLAPGLPVSIEVMASDLRASGWVEIRGTRVAVPDLVPFAACAVKGTVLDLVRDPAAREFIESEGNSIQVFAFPARPRELGIQSASWFQRALEPPAGALAATVTSESGAFHFWVPIKTPLALVARRGGEMGEISPLWLERDANEVQISLVSLCGIRGELVDAGGHPVQDARVRVLSHGAIVPSEARSDREGRFRIDSVPRGSAHVLISHPDFVGLVCFDVSAPEHLLRITLQDVREETKVFGVVRDLEGNPVADATLLLLCETWGYGRCPAPLETRSEVSGRFSFPRPDGGFHYTLWGRTPTSAGLLGRVRLTSGDLALTLRPRTRRVVKIVNALTGTPEPGVRCRVTGRLPGFEQVLISDALGRCAPDTLGGDAFEQVAVEDPNWATRTNSQKDLPRDSGEEALLEVVPRRHVSGRVVDTFGEAVPGARVSVGTPEGENPGIAPWHGLTDANGRFRIDGVLLGDFDLVAFAKGEDVVPTPSPPFRLPLEGEVSDLVIRVPRPHWLAGRVVNSLGDPVSGVRVSAVPSRVLRERSAAAVRTFRSPVTVTDANGIFCIRGLALEPHHVLARLAGHRATPQRLMPWRGAWWRSDLELALGVVDSWMPVGSAELLKMLKGLGPEMPDLVLHLGRSLVGRVVDREGMPVGFTPGRLEFEGGFRVGFRTDAEGGFEISNAADGRWRHVDPGRHEIEAPELPPGVGRLTFPELDPVAASGLFTVELGSGATGVGDLAVSRRPSLQGVVRNAAGAAWPGVLVHAWARGVGATSPRPGIAKVEATDAQGRFAFSGLERGTHDLLVRGPEGWLGGASAEAGDTSVTLSPKLAVPVLGRVAGEVGADPARVSVHATGLLSGMNSNTPAQMDHGFQFTGLLPEPLHIWAEREGFLSRPTPWLPSDPKPLVLTLERSRELRGRVTSRLTGLPLGATLLVEPRDGPGPTRVTRSDAQGNFTLTHVLSGEVRLVITSDDGVRRKTVTVDATTSLVALEL